MVRPPRFEVIPLNGIEDDVVDHLPAEATVTVTASPRQGVVATADVANRLARRGVRAAPHLAARQIHDAAELAEILQALQIGSKVGVGDSLPMLRRHGRATRRLTGAWKPEHLLEDLAPAVADHTPGK